VNKRRERIMIFRAILLCTYLLLQSAFKITTFINPSFKKRLMERDLTFVVSSKTNPGAGLFKLKEGRLSYSSRIDGFINFSAIWNGWGNADTLKKKFRLNAMDFMNKGMMTFEGDLSSMDYLLVLLGEMIGSFKKKKPTRLKRAELEKKLS
jgi:hypothetical protein